MQTDNTQRTGGIMINQNYKDRVNLVLQVLSY